MLAAIACSVALLLGPRFENAVAAALFGGMVADGRLWKYFGSGLVIGLPFLSTCGLPFLTTWSAKFWPTILEPTSLPLTLICWPLALPGKATWPTPVITSGYRMPSTSVRTTMPMAEVMRSRFISVEVGGEALHDRTEQQGGEEGERADEHDHADEKDHEGGVVGPHRPEAGGADPLAGQRTGHGQREQDRRVAGDQHVEAAEQVGQVDSVRPDVARVGLDVAGVARERRAVVVGLRQVGVEGLREALRAARGVGGDRQRARGPAGGGDRRAEQSHQRRDEQAEHDQLDLARLDLLAQVLRGAPDHQPADEHGQDHVQQDRVQAGADTAEDHLARRQVRERDGAADPREGLQRAVHRAARGDGGDDVEQGRAGDPEALILALHVAAGRAVD